MWKWFIFLNIQLVALCSCKDHPTTSVTGTPKYIMRYNSAMGASVDSLMITYNELTEDLVNWDSVSLAVKTALLSSQLNALSKKDSGYLIFAQQSKQLAATTNGSIMKTLSGNNSWEAKRHAYDQLTKAVYNYLDSIQYQNQKIYLHFCPMAFHDVDTGYWMSTKNEIRNPYMGLHHPMYHRGMLGCGETKDSINFVP